MKKIGTIILIFLSFDLFAQIDSRNDWSKSIQQGFDLIKGQKIDTFLIYYSYLGPWTDLPDSCNGISSVWILWINNKNFYSRQLFCDSINKDFTQTISSRPFNYFLNHIKDFRLKDQYVKENDFLPPIPTDVVWEYLIFMTPKNKIVLNLAVNQRIDGAWLNLKWIKPTITAIDITKEELKIK